MINQGDIVIFIYFYFFIMISNFNKYKIETFYLKKYYLYLILMLYKMYKNLPNYHFYYMFKKVFRIFFETPKLIFSIK